MKGSREGATRRRTCRRPLAWFAFAVAWILPSVGCQVQYGSMGLPSSKYAHDGIQYFPPGPTFRLANTQGPTGRARMQAMGIEPGPVSAKPIGAPAPTSAADASAVPAPDGLVPPE